MIIDTASRTSRFTFSVTLLIFGATLCSTAVYSWTGPTSTPPDGNVSAPINVGTLSQIKDGALSVNGFSNVGSSYIAGRLGVGVANPDLKLEVAGATYITGQLGVGIASPAQKVHVDGYVRATGFCINGNCATNWGSYGTSAWANLANGQDYTCPAGKVMTGLDITGNAVSGLTSVRVRCTFLTLP
jgi:hypothetical protein